MTSFFYLKSSRQMGGLDPGSQSCLADEENLAGAPAHGLSLWPGLPHNMVARFPALAARDSEPGEAMLPI